MTKHRPIEERLAALQQQMEALQVKANAKALANNPEVQDIDSRIKVLNANALKYKRWSKEAAEKVANFEARANEWGLRGQEADEYLAQYNTELKALRDERVAILKSLAAEETEAQA